MYNNRDLSWLSFNLRVLQQAEDDAVPLFERLKFLSIFSSNLDEFFRVRYPYMLAIESLGKKTQKKISTAADEDVVEKAQAEINAQLNYFGKILNEEIIPALKNNGIIFYYNMPILDVHLAEIREIFLSGVLSFIQPIILDGANDKNFLPENNKLYLLVSLKAAGKETLTHAIVNIPSEQLPRFYVLQPYENYEYVVFIDDIIRENLARIFPNMEIQGVYSIKLNRNAELDLNMEYSGDLLQKIERQLRKRDFGAPSRFLYEAGMPKNVQLFLASTFNLKFEEMFEGAHYHNLKDLIHFPKFNKDLEYKKQKPLTLHEAANSGDIFNILDNDDVLLNLPYQSYNLVLAFFNQAAVDPDVTDIYITLYRVASESHIVNALISAAKNGKNVFAFIELKARFDEENNIRWSKLMKEAGVKIIYSQPDIKVHSKIALVKKKSGDKHLSYALLSTGNFNEITAQFYTDHVLMTTDKTIIKELEPLLEFLRKNDAEAKAKIKFEKLLVSQFNMFERFEKLINGEIKKAEAGENALIRIKVNNLEEQALIDLLYKASRAGVKVHLIIRSVCCLKPGVKDLSENIIVRRLVDRYLEHTRIFIFGTDDNTEVIIGSADWMNRNLHHRIEVCTSISAPECRKELIDYFNLQWSDNDKMVQLGENYDQYKIQNNNSEKINAQELLYHYFQQSA
ncbi:MAG TPA: polyphosphate kinase 1 [Parafilimonas sp.]|nr:polyphosphate kinase 1 [Parafilimonas sp.]